MIKERQIDKFFGRAILALFVLSAFGVGIVGATGIVSVTPVDIVWNGNYTTGNASINVMNHSRLVDVWSTAKDTNIEVGKNGQFVQVDSETEQITLGISPRWEQTVEIHVYEFPGEGTEIWGRITAGVKWDDEWVTDNPDQQPEEFILAIIRKGADVSVTPIDIELNSDGYGCGCVEIITKNVSMMTGVWIETNETDANIHASIGEDENSVNFYAENRAAFLAGIYPKRKQSIGIQVKTNTKTSFEIWGQIRPAYVWEDDSWILSNLDQRPEDFKLATIRPGV